jgi:hypothetical protein
LLTGCTGRLTPVEMVLIRQRLAPPSQVNKGAGKAGVSSPSAASPGRIETDGSRTAKGILARFQGFVRSRGVPEVSLGWPRNSPSPSRLSGPAPVTGMSRSGTRAGFRACAALTPGPNGRCGFAPPGRREAQRLAVKSGEAPGNDRSPVCSGFASIAEVGECCRARSGTPSVAADGAFGWAKLALGESRAAVTRQRSSNEGVPSSH